MKFATSFRAPSRGWLWPLPRPPVWGGQPWRARTGIWRSRPIGEQPLRCTQFSNHLPAIAPRPLSPQASRKAPEADPPQATAPLYPPNETPPRPHGPTPEGRHTPTADPIGPHRPRPALRSPPGPGPPPPPGRRQPVELAADRPSAPAAGPIGSAARGRSPEDRPGNTGSPRGAQALLPARRGKRGAAPGASRGGAAGADAAPGRGPADRGVPHVGAVCRNGPAADDRTRRRGDCHARWKARTWSLAGAGGVWKATCSR
jgi:hypothetical protein